VTKVLLHQANAKMDHAILNRLFRECGVREIQERIMPMTISWLGNSSAATLPTLYDLMRKGRMDGQRLVSGDVVAFASVGAGMNINSSTVIGLQEIRASSVGNALELIQQARPVWLRSRGSTSLRDAQPTLPVVYLGEMSYGSLENLRDFELQAIQEIRFIDARSATTRFGTGHTGGVIQVILRP